MSGFGSAVPEWFSSAFIAFLLTRQYRPTVRSSAPIVQITNFTEEVVSFGSINYAAGWAENIANATQIGHNITNITQIDQNITSVTQSITDIIYAAANVSVLGDIKVHFQAADWYTLCLLIPILAFIAALLSFFWKFATVDDFSALLDDYDDTPAKTSDQKEVADDTPAKSSDQKEAAGDSPANETDDSEFATPEAAVEPWYPNPKQIQLVQGLIAMLFDGVTHGETLRDHAGRCCNMIENAGSLTFDLQEQILALTSQLASTAGEHAETYLVKAGTVNELLAGSNYADAETQTLDPFPSTSTRNAADEGTSPVSSSLDARPEVSDISTHTDPLPPSTSPSQVQSGPDMLRNVGSQGSSGDGALTSDHATSPKVGLSETPTINPQSAAPALGSGAPKQAPTPAPFVPRATPSSEPPTATAAGTVVPKHGAADSNASGPSASKPSVPVLQFGKGKIEFAMPAPVPKSTSNSSGSITSPKPFTFDISNLAAGSKTNDSTLGFKHPTAPKFGDTASGDSIFTFAATTRPEERNGAAALPNVSASTYSTIPPFRFGDQSSAGQSAGTAMSAPEPNTQSSAGNTAPEKPTTTPAPSNQPPPNAQTGPKSAQSTPTGPSGQNIQQNPFGIPTFGGGAIPDSGGRFIDGQQIKAMKWVKEGYKEQKPGEGGEGQQQRQGTGPRLQQGGAYAPQHQQGGQGRGNQAQGALAQGDFPIQFQGGGPRQAQGPGTRRGQVRGRGGRGGSNLAGGVRPPQQHGGNTPAAPISSIAPSTAKKNPWEQPEAGLSDFYKKQQRDKDGKTDE
ncbi:hypothetical protein LTR37_019014 [Vermiconidia calcicola]|uniref:Uncharacterized protein n=1 Tax=Vermiconidia calcicola TaxID=1690605 RepID=A0ACC3MFE2_9PEZI|nr:hypothetical protein LTR37_019014 [Vermiconidia calcicola]